MTNFDKIMKNMTVENFAQISVKPVVVNGTDVFYMTSTGQLFPFNTDGLTQAVNLEYQWLNRDDDVVTNPQNENKSDTLEEF